jgi:hypothetical protein
MVVMAGKSLIRIGMVGVFALVLAPAATLANQLNINTVTPVRPQIHLTPSLHMDVRSRDTYDLDLSEACRPDERLKRNKRERRCRQDR